MKLNHIAGNTLVHMEKPHCITFFRLAIASYHKNPGFTIYSKIHQFTGQGI